MADLLDFAPVRVLTSNAEPGAGYIARFFQSGTTAPVTVFTDASLATALGTSVTANAEGVFPAVFSAGGAIKATIETPAGAVVATVDPVQSIASGSAAASAISFAPTVGLPFTNVQAAIEGAAASAASGFNAFGLGVTGSVALIADLNATTIASGQYRFDATTTGTYPTGVAAADTGAVVLVRETAGSAWMRLFHDTTDRVFERRMNASAWGAWREIISVPQGAVQGDIIFRSATEWARLAAGSAGQVLRSGGAGANPSYGSAGFTYATPIASTSGSNIDFTGIPAGVTEVEVVFRGTSLSGTDNLLVQLGTSGGFVSTGYDSYSLVGIGGSSGSATSTAGFVVAMGAAAYAVTGVYRLIRSTANTWTGTISGFNTASSLVWDGGGDIALAGALTQVRITRTGTNTFDAGTVTVGWR